MRVAVVIATWDGHPTSYLASLCESIKQHSSGIDYQLILCANGFGYSLPQTLASHFSEVFVRQNEGFNLEAWDYAWRRLPAFEFYLFLQDDCWVRKDRWLERFIRRFEETPQCGLVGEHIPRSWDRDWSELCALKGTEREENRAAAARYYKERIERWHIPTGQTARHVTTVVQFTHRSILQAVDGYNFARTKGEAMAAEIGFSKKVESKGCVLTQLGRASHGVIAHRQWPGSSPLDRIKRSISKRLGALARNQEDTRW